MNALEVQTLRTRIGLSTLQLAERLGVSQQLVLDWESATRFPTLRHVRALAQLEAGSVAPAVESRPSTPLDTEVAELLRKLLAHPTLYAELVRLAANFSDPGATSLPKP